MPIQEIQVCPYCRQEGQLKPIQDVEGQVYICKNRYCSSPTFVTPMIVYENEPDYTLSLYWDGKQLRERVVQLALLGAHVVTTGTLNREANRIVSRVRNSIDIKIVRRF